MQGGLSGGFPKISSRKIIIGRPEFLQINVFVFSKRNVKLFNERCFSYEKDSRDGNILIVVLCHNNNLRRESRSGVDGEDYDDGATHLVDDEDDGATHPGGGGHDGVGSTKTLAAAAAAS